MYIVSAADPVAAIRAEARRTMMECSLSARLWRLFASVWQQVSRG
jgi:hypothetical protein